MNVITPSSIMRDMIKSFRDREAERIFHRERSRSLPYEIQRIGLRKLLQIDAATRLESLRIPPGNRLEALRGNRVGQHSGRINDQWRSASSGAAEMLMRSRSSTTMADRSDEHRLAPVHPGEILLEDFLKPMEISQYGLAKALGVPPQRIHDLVHGRRALTADTALRLARYFDMEAQFWMNLQARYDLDVTADTLAGRLDQEVRPRVA